jgi:hypothetical protein
MLHPIASDENADGLLPSRAMLFGTMTTDGPALAKSDAKGPCSECSLGFRPVRRRAVRTGATTCR